MKNLYFKVKVGYGQDDFISIGKDELEKAQYAFITDNKVMFKEGVAKGSMIQSIVPDYHRTMGWNYAHKMDSEDFGEVTAKVGNMQRWIEIAGQKVHGLIAQGKENEIGKTPLELLEQKPLLNKGRVKSIGELITSNKK